MTHPSRGVVMVVVVLRGRAWVGSCGDDIFLIPFACSAAGGGCDVGRVGTPAAAAAAAADDAERAA